MTGRKETLTPEELDTLTKQRRVLTQNRVANHVSVAESLLVVLDSPLQETTTDLLAALATLAAMTDPNQSPNWDPNRNPNNDTHIPSFRPAWADHKLDQINRIIGELAGNIDGWTHRPHDPTNPTECPDCGRKYSRDDNYCRWCGNGGIRTLRQATRRCDQCGTPFVAMKPHARYCTPRCRLAAYRRRETEETEPLNPNR